MSIRKLVGKVVGGAAVVALVVAGAVGVVLAQSAAVAHPYLANTPMNAAEDVKRGTDELPILFNVDLRAVLYAIPNLGDDGFTAKLAGTGALDATTLVTPSTDDELANVGWIFAETNYSQWDILVHRQNGGYLVREPKTGETPELIGGMWNKTCVDNNDGPFGSSNPVCDSTFEGGTMGIALKYDDGLISPTSIKPCPLELAVGVIKASALTVANVNVLSAIALQTNAGISAPLKFDTPAAFLVAGADAKDQDYASFAYSLREGATAAGLALPNEYFGAGTELWSATLGAAAPTTAAKLFPIIAHGPQFRLDREIGDPYSPVPNPTDQCMVFWINARLGFDPGGSPAEKLSSNRNGVYKENLVFTFYGLY